MTTKFKPVSLRLPSDVVKQLDREAVENSRTRTGQVQHVLIQHLRRADSAPRITTSEDAHDRR
jgi:predicted transcriptional regulator